MNRQPLESHESYLKGMAKAGIGSAIRAYVSPSDMVQSTFASAYRRMAEPGVSDIRNLKSWLAGILRNKIREAVRKFGRGKHASSVDWSIDRTGVGCEEPVDLGDTFAWLMSKLPPEQRQVVELHLLHHLEMDEIANALAITQACARKRYERAMKFLGDRIDPREYR